MSSAALCRWDLTTATLATTSVCRSGLATGLEGTGFTCVCVRQCMSDGDWRFRLPCRAVVMSKSCCKCSMQHSIGSLHICPAPPNADVQTRETWRLAAQKLIRLWTCQVLNRMAQTYQHVRHLSCVRKLVPTSITWRGRVVCAWQMCSNLKVEAASIIQACTSDQQVSDELQRQVDTIMHCE